MDNDKLEAARDVEFHKSQDEHVKGLPEVHGYDFSGPFDLQKFLAAYGTTGAQATNFYEAIEIIKQIHEEKQRGEITVYLGYTSNMVSSGLRDVIRFLVQNKWVDVLVTTGGGIEEDFIKCLAPFYIGNFELPGAQLRDAGINRIGNILVPNDHYAKFEQFLNPLLHEMADEQKANGTVITPSKLIEKLGVAIDNEESIYYWAAKNNIPVFSHAVLDGSIGDIVYFFNYKRPEFKVDFVGDVKRLNDFTLDAKKTGLIILGAGIVKHMILNTNMLRNGADLAVYINNSQEFDASDAGARPDEAVSWGKLLPEAKTVKVFGDATILFPLIVAGVYQK